MRWTKTFIPTLKEDPQEAEAASHKLMVRSGMIRRLSAGTYTYLPIGYRALEKAEKIIREEMNRAGALELLMPAIQPPELWKQTGRYHEMGLVLIKYKDRHGRECVLGPTHEEIITNIISGEVRSYKDLPLILYQIQTKFRDEVRPRFGVIRSCEFIMKDAYSFDVDVESMEKSYKAMYDAYLRIFTRCGLPFIAVEADPGLMGGTVSHEFMVPSEAGEDKIVVCPSCKYASSTEIASINAKEAPPAAGRKLKAVAEVDTPNVSTVKDVSSFLKIKPEDLIKTIICVSDAEPVAVLVRGDHEICLAKVKKYLKAAILDLADEKRVKELTGGPMGFSGPVGLSGVKILADHAVRGMINAVTGANRQDRHLLNVNPERDFKVDKWIDARVAAEGDPCPKCGGSLSQKNTIEIGHTFKLGTKYSKELNADFLDSNGKQRPIVMGCYGIGVNRIIASIIEASHDKDGIIWPLSVAPFEVVVIPVKMENKSVSEQAELIYNRLKEAGVDVIIDDREKSPGIKFKDADLVGFPLQIIIGEKGLAQGKIEIKIRGSGEKRLVERRDILKETEAFLNAGTEPGKPLKSRSSGLRP